MGSQGRQLSAEPVIRPGPGQGPGRAARLLDLPPVTLGPRAGILGRPGWRAGGRSSCGTGGRHPAPSLRWGTATRGLGASPAVTESPPWRREGELLAQGHPARAL